MQAIDRVYRIGQNKDVRVFQFIAANTVEEKVLEIQKRKNLLISQVSPLSTSLTLLADETVLGLLWYDGSEYGGEGEEGGSFGGDSRVVRMRSWSRFRFASFLLVHRRLKHTSFVPM